LPLKEKIKSSKEILLDKIPKFKSKLYYRQTKYRKDFQDFYFANRKKVKRPKNKSKMKKNDLLKSLKRKKIDKKPKKGWFLQKHTGLKSRLDESLTKTIKYKYFQNQKQNKYAYKNSTEIGLKPRRKKKKRFSIYKRK
jgi:hypothetical protein